MNEEKMVSITASRYVTYFVLQKGFAILGAEAGKHKTSPKYADNRSNTSPL